MPGIGSKSKRRRRPEVVFGADMIAGFPTEDDEAHQNSLKLIEACQIPLLHVFGYSAREGTPAAKMPQIDGAITKERSRDLRSLGTEILHKMLDGMIGRQDEILIEKGNQGHLRNFVKATVKGTARGDDLQASGAVMAVRIIGRDGDGLMVEAIGDKKES